MPLRRGDIIGIKGYPSRTNPKTKQGSGDFSGELSIAATEVTLLSPCLHQVREHGACLFSMTRADHSRSPTTTMASRTPSSGSASGTSIS